MLRVAGITKTFQSVVAVADADLTVPSGSITAVVGENGAGKTTLMRVLSGELAADTGEIWLDGEPVVIKSTADAIARGITMVHQHYALAPTATAAENIVLGREPGRRWWNSPRAFGRRVEELSARTGLAVEPSLPTGRMSVAQRQRVEILKALHRDARFLILDEPTAVLTPQESAGLFTQLRGLAAGGTGIVFISHKLPEVLALADRIVVMRKGQVVAEVDREAASAEHLAALMTGGAPLSPLRRDPIEADRQVVLDVRGLSTARRRHDCGLDDVTLKLHSGEVVGVAAVEGNGQSTLLAAVAGLERPLSGSIRLDGHEVTAWSVAQRRSAGIGYVPEDRHAEGMPPEASIYEALTVGLNQRRGGLPYWLGRARTGSDADAVRRTLEHFDVRYRDIDDPCSALSGGNQQKAMLGRELAKEPRLLLLGHPTRGVDIGAVNDLHQRILAARNRGAAVLVVSADLDEILTIADRIVVMYAGAIVADFEASSTSREAIGLAMLGQRVA